MSQELPKICTQVPGPRSRALAKRLAAVECPAITLQGEGLVFWERAAGSNVFDVDGNRFVDLLAGFGVAATGYAHPEVSAAIAGQAARLPHAMADVYPAAGRVELLEALDRVLPEDLGSAILSSSGSSAIDSALKTALRVTGRATVVAFEGAYHGLGLGALDATHRADFRAPFAARLPGRTRFVPFGDANAVRKLLRSGEVGAILVEPIQGRGGVRPAPAGFLPDLRALADEYGALLIADEIYTGLGRTGRWLACEWDDVVPDVVALGKALGGGFPIAACAGRRAVMERWGASTGEALHTSTHIGNPMGCAAALAVLAVIERDGLVERAARVGERWKAELTSALHDASAVVDVRGRGLMLGIELSSAALAERVFADALRRGWILIPEGPEANVIALHPALDVDEALLDGATGLLVELLRA